MRRLNAVVIIEGKKDAVMEKRGYFPAVKSTNPTSFISYMLTDNISGGRARFTAGLEISARHPLNRGRFTKWRVSLLTLPGVAAGARKKKKN